MTDDGIKITGFAIREKESADRSGTMMLGYFDCEVRGLTIYGCALLRTKKGGFAVFPPKLEDYRGMRAIYINDNVLRAAIMEAARAAYKALGGQHGEWAPHDSEEREKLDEWLKS